MKYVLILAAIVLIQLINVEGKKEFKECMKELGVTKEMLKEAHETKTEKPEMKCFSACLMKKNGELEAGNKVNMDKVKEHATKHHGDKAEEHIKGMQECVDAAKSITDECEFAQNIHMCHMKKFPRPMKGEKSKE